MKRKYLKDLKAWLTAAQRKPLVIRGARQVGKTWLVRDFAKEMGKDLVELNFERRPLLNTLFETNDPKQILFNLNAALNITIKPNNCILFFDEIQAMPELLAKLRWFAEELPELPVIAAGSLLEFVLEQHKFSMPVGRIQYMHIEPLSFEEFLLALDKQSMLQYLRSFHWGVQIPEEIHNQLMNLVKEFTIVGGMPAVVANWIEERSLDRVSQIQHDLIATYRDDFAKYRGRVDSARFEEILLSTPKMLGEKFVYSNVNPNVQSHIIKQALELLCKAKICNRVTSCHANGIPIGAEINEKFFKVVFLDIGLCSAILGLQLNQIHSLEELVLHNNGKVAEQLVGQLLRTIYPSYLEPELYYWLRQERNSSAEIDYLIQNGSNIVPIEVKAGSAGSLRSLHMFMGIKNLSMAVRINSSLPSITKVEMTDSLGNKVHYSLKSIPFYLIGELPRLISSLK